MEFVRKNRSSSRSLGRKWEDMILPGHENPRNCMDPDEMKMGWCLSTPGSPEYALPVAQSTSVTPVSLYTRCRSLTMYLEAVIERVERCTCRPWSIEFGYALWGRDWASLEMHFEAVIEQVWRYNWRLWSCELGGHNRASLEIHFEAVIVNSEMHWEAVIEWVWRCTCRLWSSEIGGVLGSSPFGGRHDGSWDSIHWLTCNCGKVESWAQQHPPRDGKLAGSGKLAGTGSLMILGWCCTWCMLYSVLSHDHGMER